MNKITVYGIPNCDSVKKTLEWLKQGNIPYEFHNYKTHGISELKLKEWSKLAGWEKFFNKKSSTWRKLMSEAGNENLTSAKALKLMMENTSIIKRPIIEFNGSILVGFDASNFEIQFLKQ